MWAPCVITRSENYISRSPKLPAKWDKPVHPTLFLNNNIIEDVTVHEHLGLTLSSNLSWWAHTLKIHQKVSKKLNLNPLAPVPPVTARADEPWPFCLFWRHRFWPKLASSIPILLQEEEIFPMMPRSEWSAQWSLRYAQKCSKSWMKNLEQNFLPPHLDAPC